MIPYICKYNANGALFDAIGDKTVSYLSMHATPTFTYFLMNTGGEVYKHNFYTETTALTSCLNAGTAIYSIIEYNGEVYGFRGRKAKPYKDKTVLYIKDENQLVQESYDFATYNILLRSATKIVDFTIDQDYNYYVVHGETKITKFNDIRKSQYSVSLTDTTLSAKSAKFVSVDIIREFTPSGIKQYPIALGQTHDTNLFLCKIDEDTESISNITMLNLSGDYYNSNINVINLTNYNHVLNNHSDTTLNVKFRLFNTYNNRGWEFVDIPIDISQYTVGEHHLVVRFDSIQGNITVFIDGKKYTNVEIDPGKYIFQDILQDSIGVGATYFYNNKLLSQTLKQPGYYFVDGIRMKQFKLYKAAISDTDVRFLTFNNIKMGDMIASLPSDQRNALDIIEKQFKFGVPGMKSNNINIRIKNCQITDTGLQERIKERIRREVQTVLPVNTVINNIEFNSYEST